MPQRGHGTGYAPSRKWHGFEEPTKQQVAARMNAHRSPRFGKLDAILANEERTQL